MKILLCISIVPDTTSKISFIDNNTQLDRSRVQFILNPYDEIALACAIETCQKVGGSVTAIHVGQADSEPTLRKVLAIGADDAIRIDAVPQDAYFVSCQLAAVIKEKDFDIILAGRESIDYNGSHVTPMLGELLGIPSITAVKKLSVEPNGIVSLERDYEGGKELITLSTPFVASCTEGAGEPKIANMRGIMMARTKPLNVISGIDVQSYTKVRTYESFPLSSGVKMFSKEEISKLAEAIRYIERFEGECM